MPPEVHALTEDGVSPDKTTTERPLNFEDFSDWLEFGAKKRVLWHEGFLSVDRNASDKKSDEEKYKADALNDYARLVVSSHYRGEITLTQQKTEKFNYRYYAEKP
jgi:hypothetical protein